MLINNSRLKNSLLNILIPIHIKNKYFKFMYSHLNYDIRLFWITYEQILKKTITIAVGSIH